MSIIGVLLSLHPPNGCCCLAIERGFLAKSTESPEKRMLAMQREQRAMPELQRFERIAALERRIFEHAFAAFDQVEQQLGTGVQVKALPAPEQTSAADATPKRKSAKAITTEFETLDASQAPESGDASNGNGKHPFRHPL